MFEAEQSANLYQARGEILATALSQVKTLARTLLKEARDVHLKQIARSINLCVDVVDAFRSSNVDALKNGKRSEEDTQTLMKLLSTMKTAFKQCISNVHTIQSELTTGLNEHQEIMNLRAENVRLQFKDVQGGPIVALRNVCNEQKRAIMNLEDENNNLRRSLKMSKARQSRELKDLTHQVVPLDEKMKGWQRDVAEMREFCSINMKHNFNNLKSDLEEMREQFRKFKLKHDEELLEAKRVSDTVKQAWEMHARRTKRLQIGYDSIMPYLYGQGIKTNLKYQKEHITLAQGIDCLRVELDDLDKRYTLTTQHLEMARAECHILREKYMSKVLDSKKRKETSQSTINLKLIKDAHQQEIDKLQNRHKDEIKRLKKDHEMELTYQIRNNVNKSENEAAHRYTEQLENDLKHSKEELAKLKLRFNQNEMQQQPVQSEVNVLHTPVPSLSNPTNKKRRSLRKPPPVPITSSEVKESSVENSSARSVKEVPQNKLSFGALAMTGKAAAFFKKALVRNNPKSTSR